MSSLTFLVKWLGYDEIPNSHEPCKGIKDNVKLHDFLISKNVKNLISRKYLLSTTASIKTADQTTDDTEN